MLAGWVDAAASLLLGSACPGCRAPCAHLCAACAAEVAAAEPFAVALPAAPVPFVPVVAAARYEELWQRCILAYKERTGWWLGGVLGAALALAVADALRRGPGRPDPLVLVPMPSQRATVRERGLDTTLLLARTAARRLAASGHRIAVAHLDACDVREGRYAATVGRQLGFPCTVVANHHADGLLAVVAVASIVAKVHRDRSLRALEDEHGPLGSGYPSDPATCRFLDDCLDAGGPLPPFVRASWRTVTNRQRARAQTTLF